MNPEYSDIRIPVSKAREVLLENICGINSALEWSLMMNWSCFTRFSRKFRKHHGKRPSHILIETKVKIAVKLLEDEPALSCFEIAERIGKTDDKALNKFLKHHTGRPPSWFRKHTDYKIETIDINGNEKQF